MALLAALKFARLSQLLLSVIAHGFQKSIAGYLILIIVHHDHGLVQQAVQHIEDAVSINVVSSADCFRCFQRPTAHAHCQAPQHGALRRVE